MGLCMHIEGVFCDNCTTGSQRMLVAAPIVVPFVPALPLEGGAFTFDAETLRRREAKERLDRAAPLLLEALKGVLAWEGSSLPGGLAERVWDAIEAAEGQGDSSASLPSVADLRAAIANSQREADATHAELVKSGQFQRG